MHDRFQLPPPRNWQDFESLCRDLYALVWSDPGTKKNGRASSPQHGVDVYGYTNDGKLNGVQCKKKDAATGSVATAAELRGEVKKALNFSPKLSSFIFATTSPNDEKLEEVARTITAEHAKEGLFSVRFSGWDDILDLIGGHDTIVKQWYRWAVPGNDPNEFAFEFWSAQFNINYIFLNACLYPFASYQVTFRPAFLADLNSFYDQSRFLLSEERTRGLNPSLRFAIENFNNVSLDLIQNATIDYSRPDAGCDKYMYWINKGRLPYHQQGDYVEYKKHVLRFLFYHLILAANYIIDIKNKISNNAAPQHSYIKFTDSFDSYISYKFPMYDEGCTSQRIFYPGLEWIKEKSAEGAIDPVRNYERQIEGEAWLTK
jgi:hypothetical protein